MADPVMRKLARQLVGVEKRLRDLETVPQLAHSSIDDGALPVYSAAGELTARIGKQADGTWGAPPIAGPTPPMPAGVSAVGGPGTVTFAWTGEFETGAAPLDFDTLEVLIDGVLAGAVPNRDGGTVTISAVEGIRYVSARIRTLVPRHSSTTSPFSVTVGPPPDELFAAAQEQIQQGRDDLEAERVAREEALADAAQNLQDLADELATMPSSGALEAVRGEVAAAQRAVQTAQQTADEAAASALVAAGIAADKGRIFYRATAPTGDAQSPNNLWIDSDDGRVYVWNGSVWEESQSEDLRDAAQAAVVAQQVAEAADRKAQDAATAAAAAQRTADQATLSARDAHNEAVSAAARAQAKIDAGESLLINGSFEQGDIGWPENGSHGGRSRIIEDPGARTGTHVLELTPTTGSTYPESDFYAAEPGQVLQVRGWYKHLGGDGKQARLLVREHDAGKAYIRISYAATLENVQTWPVGEWVLLEGDFTVPENTRWLRFAFHATGPTTSAYHADDFQVVDVTEARAAQARADEAYGEAASKATPAQVTAAAEAAQQAAITAARTDAAAKAAAAKADALAGAAVTAQEKADAAQAAAEAAAAQDAAEKTAQALRDALTALESARGEIEQAIIVSANGKNAITVSSDAPTSAALGAVVGDTWFRVDVAGDIFGQWSWTGSAWAARSVTSDVIANLDVGKLTVTGTSRFTVAVVDRLFADIFAAHKITANELVVAALDEDGEIKPDSVEAVMIKDGQISANKILLLGDPNDPDEAALVATIASIMKLAVENLVVTEGAMISSAVVEKLAAQMITAGVLRTAETGQRVVIDGDGVVLYGVDADGNDTELVRIGPSGANLITVGGTTVSPDGVQSPAGSFDSLSVGGDSLPDLLAALPKGMVAWGQLATSSQLDGGTSDYARRGEIQTALERGRLYRIHLSEHLVEVSGGKNTNIVEELRYSFDGTPIFQTPTPNAGTHRGVFMRNPVFAGSGTSINGMEFMLDTGSWKENRGFWLMWMIRPEVAGRPVRVLATSFYSPVLTIEDMGPSMPPTLKRWNDGDGGGTAPGPVDPAPVVVRRTQTWAAASYGGDTRDGKVYQGTYPGYGNRWGGWVFYPAMRDALSGSTIEKFEVYLVNSHWYYGSGGTAVIYPNDGSYKGTLGGGVTSANWPRGAGRWVTVPSSWHAAIARGKYRGISVYASSTNLIFYGLFKAASTKFRVTYRK